MDTTKIALFKGKQIRKVIYLGEWWFSVIDIIKVLSESDRPRKYWNDLKTKLLKEGYVEVSEKIGQLKLEAPDGKLRETDCASTKTIFRIVQTISSPKAEPFKRWLAKVDYERIKEIEDPELAMDNWINSSRFNVSVCHPREDGDPSESIGSLYSI